MFKTFKFSDQTVLLVDMSLQMHLNCGCTLALGKLMVVIGQQIQRGEPVICPYHEVEHDFSNHVNMKSYSVAYLKHCLEEEDTDFVTLFPPTE